jgi:hypothetical protein
MVDGSSENRLHFTCTTERGGENTFCASFGSWSMLLKRVLMPGRIADR